MCLYICKVFLLNLSACNLGINLRLLNKVLAPLLFIALYPNE